jgi:hypothetical protein
MTCSGHPYISIESDQAEGELVAGDDDNAAKLQKMEGCMRQTARCLKRKVESLVEQWEKEMHTPKEVAHMHECLEEIDRSVNEQCSKWEEFMINKGMVSEEDGLNLLMAMELVDEEMEAMDVNDENMVLSESVVVEIEEARKEGCIKPCGYKKKMKEDNWGPILVERPRRRTNDGIPVMDKAMNLKRKKNLEPLKGNQFAVLHNESLK